MSETPPWRGSAHRLDGFGPGTLPQSPSTGVVQVLLPVNRASVGAMTRPSRRTAVARGVSSRQVGAGVLVALGALVFSTGPLYRIRSWWEHDDPLAADVAVIAVQSLFGLIGLVALVSGARWRLVDRRLAVLATLLVAWMVLSALWSADAGTTLRESSMVGVTLVAGTGAAVAVRERMLVFAGWVGVHIGLAWSAVGIATLQPGTQDSKGWTGVYFNPNSLALVAAVGLLLSVVLATQHWRSRGRWPILMVLAVAVAADLWLIRGTDSLTPLAALLFALVAAAAGLGRTPVRRSRPSRGAIRHHGRRARRCGCGRRGRHRLPHPERLARLVRAVEHAHRPYRDLGGGLRLVG
jgi:hypothetical protein